MTVRSLVRAWNEFFFKPQSPTPVALFRILYGLLLTINLLMLRPDWFTWYGTHAFMSMRTMYAVATGTRINLFTVLPQSDAWIDAFFWVFLLSALCLTVGFKTRLSSIVAFVCLTSIHQRNFYILNSGDTVMRVTGFFLMFAPAGAAISMDRLIRIWRGQESVEVQPRSPWAQRMIQIETALAYFGTFYWKTLGKTWMDGTAVYYTFQLEEFRRFPVPFTESDLFLKLSTWMTLVIEFAAGVLIWFRDLRYPILLIGLCFHLGIEYSMNIQLFEWIILSTYVTFIYPEDLQRAWAWVRARAQQKLPQTVDVIYDGSVARLARMANLLRAIDVFARLRVMDLRSPQARSAWSSITVERGRGRMLFGTPAGLVEGRGALAFIAPLVPLLWPLAPAALFSGQRKQALKAASAAK